MAVGHAVMINGKVFFGGGFCDDYQDEFYIYCYDLAQDVWSTLPKLSVRWFALGVVKGELVLVGGFDQTSSASSAIHVLANGNNWRRSIPPMPTARYSTAVVSLPTHLVIAGGYSGDYTNIVEIYNVSTSQWSKADRLPSACKRVQRGIVCNNTVYLVSRYDEKSLNTLYAAQVDCLTSADRHDDGSADSVWKELMNTPFVNPIVVTISDTIFALGGVDREGVPTQKVHAYSHLMDSWLNVGKLPFPLIKVTTVPLSPTDFLIIGGKDKARLLSTTYKIFIKSFVH